MNVNPDEYKVVGFFTECDVKKECEIRATKKDEANT